LPPSPRELALPRLQRWMQAVIEQPGEAAEAVTSEAARAELDPEDIGRVILPSKTLSSVERVGVYQGMYLLRMIEDFWFRGVGKISFEIVDWCLEKMP